jgi:trehalose-6-phosphatase
MNRNASDRAVFLDRDGTLMEDSNYVGEVERVVPIPDAAEALQQLRRPGFSISTLESNLELRSADLIIRRCSAKRGRQT